MEDAAKGATTAALEFTEEKLKELLFKLQNHELAFIQSKDNIRIVKQEKASSEYKTLCQFLPKGWLRIVVQMGLALRDVSSNKDRTIEIRDAVMTRFGEEGLHIAEITQIGITRQLLVKLTSMYPNPVDVQKKLSEFLEHVDDMVIFIQARAATIVRSKANLIKLRIESNSTHIMIVAGRAGAKPVVRKILDILAKDARKYPIEIEESGYQITAFVFTPEVKAKVSHWSDVFDDSK